MVHRELLRYARRNRVRCGEQLLLPRALPQANSHPCVLILHGPLWCADLFVGRDPYDLTYPCDDAPEPDDFCYRSSEDKRIERYLNRPDIRALLGVDNAAGNFSMSNMKVNQDFAKSGDLLRTSRAHIEQLLERGVRVLSYAGTLDYMANHVSLLHALLTGLDY